MSETSSLSELARFVGRSDLNSEDASMRQLTVSSLALRLSPDRRSVADLLGAVLAVSARTRRMLMPPASVELDVFAPGGVRAVRLMLQPR